tara:strand:+ start:4590 stop:5495 length:906 start_codon:yes stop_codon:yes gene_type:complete
LNSITNPLVSIIIPTYNHGHFLGRALQSIVDQTYSNWEVYIVDGNSTDNTTEVVENFIDPRIKYLKTEIKGSIAASRNVGIEAASGEWIAFLDSDDWWKVDKLETCLKYITEEVVDLIYHDMEIKYINKGFFNRKKTNSRQLKKPILIDLLVVNNPIYNSSVVVRKKLLNKIDGLDEKLELVAVEDYHTWLRIAKLTNNFFYLPYTLGYYLIHDQNISRKDMSIPTRHAVSEFIKILTQKQKLKLEANMKYTSGRFNYINCNYKKAKKELFFAFKNGNNSIKLRSLIMLIIIPFKFNSFFL